MPATAHPHSTSRLVALSILAIPAAFWLLLAPAVLADVMAQYGGAEYEGRVDTHFLLPDGRKQSRPGRGSAELIETSPGKAQLILRSRLNDQESHSEIKIEGFYDANGWHSEPGQTRVTISSDGKVSGGGKGDGQTFDFSGDFSPRRAMLETVVRMDQPTGGLPAGSVMTVEYRLHRDEPHTAQASPEPSDGRRCKRMGTRTVTIANVGGGGMSMGVVPECQEYE